MRLVSLELDGFRGFPKSQLFDLDADAIVLVGANGNGKTSFFDGILWALCGQVSRLKGGTERFISLYSETGKARAVLTLRSNDKRTYKISRTFDGAQTRVSLVTDEKTVDGPSAEGRLLELLWPEAASASAPEEALGSVITRCIYLQQDSLRHFVEASSDQDRFLSVSELFGSGRVTELQSELENAKRAWSTATNQRREGFVGMQERLRALEVRARELGTRANQEGLPISASEWTNWWTAAARLGVKAAPPDPSLREAPSAIDAAIKMVDSLRGSTERRLQSLHAFAAQIADLKTTTQEVDLVQLRERSVSADKKVVELRVKVAAEIARLTEQRRNQAALREKGEQLKALASIALHHLDGKCPVCDQEFDHEATKSRLEALLGNQDEQTASEDDANRLNEYLDENGEKDKEATSAASALREAQEKAVAREFALKGIQTRSVELGIEIADGSNYAVGVARALEEVEQKIGILAEVQKGGESLALRLAQSAAQGSLLETNKEIETLRRAIAEQEKFIVFRDATGERAQKVIEALREAASTVVTERLTQLEPILQSTYARIDPHPAFTRVEFLSNIFKGKGLLSTVVKDTVGDKSSSYPSSILSSSQVNALAVSIFLSFNLGVAKPPLSTVLLDDPLQSLDDVNLLGLVDLLRRAKEQRQLCVSTHDARFANLLSRKLRPADKSGRTVVIELNGWTRQGPTVEVREIQADPAPLRLMAS